MLKPLFLKPQGHLSAIELIVYALASWRMAYMLVNEAGPFMMFTQIRKVTGIQHDNAGKPIAWPDVNLLSCIYCTSMWTALFSLIIPRWLVNILAISGLAILVESANG
jgi:hypothetical protein